MIDSVANESACGTDLKRARRVRSPQRAITVDRLPPNAPDMEQGVLGCCLISPNECIAEAVGVLQFEAFYDLRHQIVWDELVEMWDERVGIDVITLQQRLKDKGMLEQVGGIAYLSSLPDVVPSASNLAFYLEAVKEKYILRRMISACTDAVARVYDHEGRVDELVDEVEHDLGKISKLHAGEDEKQVKELVTAAIDKIELLHAKQGALLGISTGITDLDRMTSGLKPGEMFVIAGRPGTGKAQPLTSLVLTPSGFLAIGDLRIGDKVIGEDGRGHAVTSIHPQGVKPIHRVTLSDGSVTRCCADHLWFTQTRNERRRGCFGSVKTTIQIKQTIRRPDGGRRNHVIPSIKPIEFASTSPLPIHPWLLGALLGDGQLNNSNIAFHKPERDIIDRVVSLLPGGDIGTVDYAVGRIRIRKPKRGRGYSATKIAILALGINKYSEDKFIPHDYLFAPWQDRLDLLRGLLDTDGYVLCSGSCVEFSTSSPRLAKDVSFLARSLGGICSSADVRTPVFTGSGGQKKSGLPSYRMNIWFEDPSVFPITSEKHLSRWTATERHVHRSIADIEPDGEAECQCITIDSESGLYLTDDFIVTHNSSLGMQIAEHVAIDQKLPVGVFSLEMMAESLILRVLCSRARVNLRRLAQDGHLVERDFAKITSQAGLIQKAPIHIDDSSGLSILRLKAKARRMAQQYGIKLFVIDYLQLLHSTNKKADNRQQEIADISIGCKELAKELEVPIIVLAQLNRESEKNKRKPKASDLRESGQIEQDADIIGLLYPKDEEKEEGEPRPYDYGFPVGLGIVKQREGETGEVDLLFHKHITRFENVSKISDGDVSSPYADN